MQITLKRTVAVLAAAALAAPAGALAHENHGKGPQGPKAPQNHAENHGKGKAKGKNKPKLYVFKGVVKSNDGTTLVVTVAKGNHWVKRYLKGAASQDVSFTLADKGKVIAADTNGDGKVDLNDVKVGDNVLVQARLPRDAKPGADPVAARKVIDQTNPPAPKPDAPEAPKS